MAIEIKDSENDEDRRACYCGAIAYEAAVQPCTITICHCDDCQEQSGSAFQANIAAPTSSFRLTRGGTPRTYIKTAVSGNQRAVAFCAVCGSPLYACAVSDPSTYSLRISTINQRHELGSPLRQIWTCRRHGWVDLPEGTASFEGQP